MSTYFNVGVPKIRVSAHAAGALGDVVVIDGTRDHMIILSIHMSSADARRLAAELLAAVNKIESLSSPPDPTAASLPAAGGAFYNEVTP